MRNLVFHQGDEWGDNNACSLHCKGWDLECYAFASSRWHKAKSVIPGIYAIDNLALNAAEFFVSPIF
jgi:hypothetical protein